MNVSNVDSLLAQMRAAMVAAQGGSVTPTAPSSVDFADVLKNSIDGVAKSQNQAQDMQNAFVMGDDRVSLSDTMISMQKANIQFQTTLQVRNKVIAAYNDIMNMQV